MPLRGVAWLGGGGSAVVAVTVETVVVVVVVIRTAAEAGHARAHLLVKGQRPVRLLRQGGPPGVQLPAREVDLLW